MSAAAVADRPLRRDTESRANHPRGSRHLHMLGARQLWPAEQDTKESGVASQAVPKLQDTTAVTTSQHRRAMGSSLPGHTPGLQSAKTRK